MSKAIKAGVIGHPIAHSKSPIIHEYWMVQHGIEGSYERIDIAPDELQSRVRDLVAQGYDGFNVTLPHKQSIMALCDEVDATAQAIGAVNTVRIEGGKLYGKNTDAFGFIENIKQSHPEYDLADKNALIIGAGGAARAVVYGLLQAGVRMITITNRTREKAEDLCAFDTDKIRTVAWEERDDNLQDIDMVINTSALGMAGKPSLEFDLSNLKRQALVCDIVYTPLMTDLLKAAEAQGHKIVTGVGMLIHQARPAFEAWSGVRPEADDEIERLLLL